MQRLNMWQRLGIVLSVLWILVAVPATYFLKAEEASDFAGAHYSYCIQHRGDIETPQRSCEGAFLTNYGIIMEYVWLEAAFYAVIPILLGWLLAYVGLRTFRWVLAGQEIKR